MWRRRAAAIGSAFILLVSARAHAATLTVGTDADTYVNKKMDTVNFGNQTVAVVGRTLSGSGAIVDRALLHFDLTGLPLDRVVTNATLRLFIDGTTGPTPLNLTLMAFRLTMGFNENLVTWATQPAVFPGPTGTGTMNTLPGDWFVMDLTAIVSAVHASGDPTNAWLRVGPTDETTNEFRNFSFRTKENGSGDDRAQLVITFEHAAAAPTLSRPMIALLLAVLGVIGILGLRRVQRHA